MGDTFPLFRNGLLILVLGAGLAACSGGLSPTAPEVSSTPVADAADGGRITTQGMPDAVFRTLPAPDDEGVIRGNGPLTVQFNNCQSRPAQGDDDLRFTYDFDSDGQVDALGHCRWEHTYTRPAVARVCVSDRRGNDACRAWEVRPGAGDGTRPRVTEIRFTVDYISGGGEPPFEFYLNGAPLGVAAVTNPSGSCNLAPATAVFSNPKWIEDQANDLRFVKGPAATLAWPSVGWVHVQVLREDGTSKSVCLYDNDGVGPCSAAPNSCLFPPNNWSPVDVTVSMS